MSIKARSPMRYLETEIVGTPLNQFDDVVNFLNSLTSKEYLVNLIVERHKKTAAESEEIAKVVIPHIQSALGFIEQASTGPHQVSFLPCYYAVLNLLKVYILLGPYADSLSAQRHHGATYDVNAKTPESLLDETITLKGKGAIPLFYKTITNLDIPEGSIKLADIYPYLEEASSEYMILTKKTTNLCGLKIERFMPQADGKSVRAVVRIFNWGGAQLKASDILLFKGDWKVEN